MLKHKQHQTIVLTGTAIALGLAGIVGTTIPAQATGSEVKIDVNVRDTVSLAIYPHGDHTEEIDQLSLQDAIPGGDMIHNSLDLVVRTNVTTGYQLTMRDTDTDTDLAQVDGAGKIPTLESNALATEFPSSRWGYAVGEHNDTLEFSGIPSATAETAALISKSASSLPDEGETTTVTFGARIGAELEPGQYEGSVMFTVVPELMPEPEPEPEPDPTAFFKLTNMQDMTNKICQDATTPTAFATPPDVMPGTTVFDTDGSHIGDTNYVPRVTLTDTRDNKTYTVSKLADGNCWMSQDLNLSLSGPLTSEKTDLPEGTSWTPEKSTQSGTLITSDWKNPDSNTARSYAANGRVYYNWRAATAGTTNENTTSGEATGSVCPKGWKLPSGGVGGEYNKLADSYGITGNDGERGWNVLRRAELNFQANGRFYFYELNDVDSVGYYWSRTAESSTTAHALVFSQSSTSSIGDNPRGQGVAIRCVAR